MSCIIILQVALLFHCDILHYVEYETCIILYYVGCTFRKNIVIIK